MFQSRLRMTNEICEKAQMIKIASSLHIKRPVSDVFAFIASSANDFAWQYGTLTAGRLSAAAAARGGSFRSVGHLMGRRMVSTFEVTEFELNRRYGFRSLTGPLISRTLYTLEATAGGTRISVATQAVRRDGSVIPGSGLEKYMQKELQDNLSRLKTIMEEARVAERLV